MTREDFLRELRISLQGRIPQGQVNEQLNYYENYIIEESKKGRTEEEVLLSLGNPRLIAKTIVDTSVSGIYYEGHEEKEQKKKEKKAGFHTWYGRLAAAAAAVIFLILLVRIGILLFPVLAAFFMLGSIGRLLFKLFSGNKK